MTVNEGDTQGEVLGEADEGVVDGLITVGVKLSHHFTDNPGGFHVAAVWAKTHVAHLIQDSPLDGFQPVTGVWQRPLINHRVGVFEERVRHFVGQFNIDNSFAGC